MACMNMIIHDMEGTIEIDDIFKNPKFRDKRGKLHTFDRFAAKPKARWGKVILVNASQLFEKDELKKRQISSTIHTL